ncbi:MAG: metallophosphoesterase family protein [Solirubrobacteraceae bacterium]
MAEPWILHMSDPHLGDHSPGQTLDDEKEVLEAQPDLETTQTVFKRTLRALGRFVKDHGKPEVAVISGDLAYRAHPSGFAAFTELLSERADILPDRSRIVVVPGNHDVVWDEEPGTLARYKGFLSATRAQGCVTPLLDGIDFDAQTGALTGEAERHPHVASTDNVLVVALNTSNYCGVLAAPRGAMSEEKWREALEPLGAARDELMTELRRLRQHDMPRISRLQIEALGAYFEQQGLPRHIDDDTRLRVAVLHHQLLPVSTREERKPFEALVNLGLVRETLHDYGIELVLHGHKHESGMYWDLATERGLTAPARRILVISSPGQFNVDTPTMRAIMLLGSPSARNARIFTFKGAGSYRQQALHDESPIVPLWLGDTGPPSEQTLIAAPSTHRTYGRLRALFELRDSEPLRNLVCEVADPADAGTPPPDLPVEDPQVWLTGLVDWWQRERSELIARDLLPFNHGERIYRRWGDQVERAIQMLNDRDDSSRALVALIDPSETGRRREDPRPLERGSFPAFALAEFSLTERDGQRYLDCTGYFRKQEMQYWWPVNVAELARLQENIRAGLISETLTGRLVTFSAIALWKGAVPRVAVPVVDLLVEEPIRLLAMAAAVAFPGSAATAQAIADWRQVLGDLAGAGRGAPPKVSAGVEILYDNVTQLIAAASATGIADVAAALDELRDQYAAHADRDELPNAAAKIVTKAVAKLSAAVTKVLPDAVS